MFVVYLFLHCTYIYIYIGGGEIPINIEIGKWKINSDACLMVIEYEIDLSIKINSEQTWE